MNSATESFPDGKQSDSLIPSSHAVSTQPNSTIQDTSFLQGLQFNEDLNDQERKRLEAIFELITTEHEYCQDLQLVIDIFREPLLRGEGLRADQGISDASLLVDTVFANITELWSISSEFCRELDLRKLEQNNKITLVGDILLKMAEKFQPYIEFAVRFVHGQFFLEEQLKLNEHFAAFVSTAERLAQCRKLPLSSFVGRPPTRLARYPLLFEAILKRSLTSSAEERSLIQKAVEKIRCILNIVNDKTGVERNRLRLSTIASRLSWSQCPFVDLRLEHPSRTIVREGILQRRSAVDTRDRLVFLFDHVLLLTRPEHVKDKKYDIQYTVHKPPIPLELLVLTDTESKSVSSAQSPNATRRPSLAAHMNSTKSNVSSPSSSHNQTSLTITHLGRHGQTFTLHASNFADHKQWKDAIEKQVAERRKVQTIFYTNVYHSLSGLPQVLCCASYVDDANGNSLLLLGSEIGVHVVPWNSQSPIIWQLNVKLEHVTHIEILHEPRIILVLANTHLLSLPIETLHDKETDFSDRLRRISSGVNFFRVGQSYGKCLIVAVKIKQLASTIKVFEPTSGSKLGAIARLLQSGLRSLENVKLFKEFYIGSVSSSVFFFPQKLCIGCSKGFEIVDLDSLRTQELLDPSDHNLDFVHSSDISVRPVSIFSYSGSEGYYVVCYNNFAFMIDKTGKRVRYEWRISWQGDPLHIVYCHPYLLGINVDFIEVWHIESALLCQIQPMRQVHLAYSNESRLFLVTSNSITSNQDLVSVVRR